MKRVRPRTHRNRSGDESASSGAAASHRYSCRIPSVCRIYYLSFVKILLVPTSADWMRAVTDKEFIEVFSHTIFSSFVATATAIVFGFIFAYGVNYTNMPCKRFFQVVALLPTMAPSVVSGLAFIMLFGRRGFITWEMLHLKVDLYGPVGLWVAQTIAFSRWRTSLFRVS